MKFGIITFLIYFFILDVVKGSLPSLKDKDKKDRIEDKFADDDADDSTTTIADLMKSDYSKLGCTAVVVGHGATNDGSAITTHNADCMNCDFRIAKTPSKIYQKGKMKTILKYKPDYPHFVTDTRSSVWFPENIDSNLPQRKHWSNPDYIYNLTLGHIPEVEETYGMIEGLFGIMNEAGVAIGESTCGAIWYGKPPRACPDCEGPQIDISMLSLIALERCHTARCAIELMGGTAESLGYYAADLVEAEGGEGLTVIDNTEAWVFHIMPDKSGNGAIWVAQRVPETHVAAIANAFIIREVDPDKHTIDFLYSSNLWSAAEEAGLWSSRDGKLLDFARVYGYKQKLSAYITRRQWRVMDLVAPSQNLPYDVDWVGDGLPFSVAVDEKITVRDVMTIKRDYYEGTRFDLSKGIAAGPYGDPRRYDVEVNTDYNQDNVSLTDKTSGGFERAISLMRTSYSAISVSYRTKNRLDHIHGVVWVAQYAPHMSVYIPIFVGAGDNAVPKPLSTGSLWRFDETSAFWRVCSVGNWASHFFKYAFPDVQMVQKELEDQTFEQLEAVQSEARSLMASGYRKDANDLLAAFSQERCSTFIDAYTKLFTYLVGKYHDGYSLASPTSNSTINMRKLFYPKWWLKVAGYWSEYDYPPDYESQNSLPFMDKNSAVISGSGSDSGSGSSQTGKRDDDNSVVDTINGIQPSGSVVASPLTTSSEDDYVMMGGGGDTSSMSESRTVAKDIIALFAYLMTLLVGILFGVMADRCYVSSNMNTVTFHHYGGLKPSTSMTRTNAASTMDEQSHLTSSSIGHHATHHSGLPRYAAVATGQEHAI